MRKLIHSYCVATGVVHFVDGTKGLLTPAASGMIDRTIYMLAGKEDNFQEKEVPYENEIADAFDALIVGGKKDG